MSLPTELVVERLWDGSTADAEERVVLVLEWGESLVVHVDAPWHGDAVPDGPPGPTDRLWEHEVVELFAVGTGERPSYTEIELGPHGHHLVLRLEGVRNPVQTLLPLDFTAERVGERWRGVAKIPREILPDPVVALNAYAIHGAGPDRRYLAWAPVPGDGPDFHRLQHFPRVDRGGR